MRPAPALALVLLAVPGAQPARGTERVPFDALFGPRTEWRATELAFRPDGEVLAFFWEEGGAGSLRGLDSASGSTVFDFPFARLAPEGSDVAIEPERLIWSPRGDLLLLVADGDLFRLEPATGSLRRLTRTESEEENPTFSPDGARVAFVRDADLYLLELDTLREVRITRDGREGAILNGKTDWVYWEEIWNRRERGIWWSPQGDAIAFYRFDLGEVGGYPLLDERSPYPRVRWQSYPKAGTANPRVRVVVADAATQTLRTLATGDEAEHYLARVHWSLDGRQVAVERLDREQTQLDLLACDPLRGDCVVWASQSAATWVNLNDDFRYLPQGGFLWSAEDEGWRRLYRHDGLGRRRGAVTPEGWALAELEGVYDLARFVVVTAFRTDGAGPAERQVLRVDLDTLEVRWIGDGDGWHGAEVDPTGRFWLHEWSDRDQPVRKTVETTAGRVAFELPGAPDYAFDPAALPRARLQRIPGPGGSQLPALLLLPTGFDPARRYPVLMYHYGGPGSQVVVDGWTRRTLWHKWMADRGYVVLMVDNEASLFFGKRGEDRVHRAFGPLELAAQLAAVDFLRTQAYADGSRLGLWGWSGGGTNTLYALFHAPGTWRAAVAGAPVTDWSYYDSIWTERYLDHPASNAEGYRHSSPLTAAESLADALLLVHGTGDDNVHPQSSIALSERLVAAGRPFEQFFYPREKHALEPGAMRDFYRRMTEFFDRHLRP